MAEFPFLTYRLLSLNVPQGPRRIHLGEEMESSAILLMPQCRREADSYALEQVGGLHSFVIHSLLPSFLITSTVNACYVTDMLLPDAHIFHFP